MPPCINYKNQSMKLKQKCKKSISFIVHKKSSINDLIMNNLDNHEELLVCGALECTNFFEETSIMAWTMLSKSNDEWGDAWECIVVALIDEMVWVTIRMTGGW